jgi:hypothetical protein
MGEQSDSFCDLSVGDPLLALDATTLLQMCEDGDDAACRELDRRGVEPPMLPPGLDPVINAAA